MNKSIKLTLIIVGIILAVIIFTVFALNGVPNKVINLITESSISKCKIYIDALCGDLSRTIGRFHCRRTSRANCCKELADDRHKQFWKKDRGNEALSGIDAKCVGIPSRRHGTGGLQMGAGKILPRHCHSRRARRCSWHFAL